MNSEQNVPADLGDVFGVAEALRRGVTYDRLRHRHWGRPFHGVRRIERGASLGDGSTVERIDPFEAQRRIRVRRAHEYLPRMHPDHFFSHETAASIWGAPLPLTRRESGDAALEPELAVHVSALGAVALPRARGVTHHRANPRMVAVRELGGVRVTSPATTWASLGMLALPDLIALGDYFCRVWRPGIGRRTPGRTPMADVEELRSALAAGRRRGGATLREALGLIREDSWSPRESRVRFELVSAGLPEPELNVDVFDAFGRFLACVDMLYREQRVVVEYHGMLHRDTWAADVERVAALRAAGWIVIEVTYPLLANPTELVRRVARGLAR